MVNQVMSNVKWWLKEEVIVSHEAIVGLIIVWITPYISYTILSTMVSWLQIVTKTHVAQIIFLRLESKRKEQWVLTAIFSCWMLEEY